MVILGFPGALDRRFMAAQGHTWSLKVAADCNQIATELLICNALGAV